MTYSLVFTTAVACLQLGLALSSSDIPEFPGNRFRPWNTLDWLTRNDARYLLYTKDTWDNFLTSPLERMSYETVANFLGLNNAKYISQWQRTNTALQQIAVDSRTWDCWINHYVGNDWEDLKDKHNVSWALEALGWNETTWRSEDPDDWPDSENKRFSELAPHEAFAAERICCPAELWDGLPVTEWEYDTDGVSTVELEFQAKHYPLSSQAANKDVEVTLEARVETTEEPTEYVRVTDSPTASPTSIPTESRTQSGAPTEHPSLRPTVTPSYQPSGSYFPSSAPSIDPTISAAPSDRLSQGPSLSPSTSPSTSPTDNPTITPSFGPTTSPSVSPTAASSSGPTSSSTTAPTFSPSLGPSADPTTSSSAYPSLLPSFVPSSTLRPSASPSASISNTPTVTPTNAPSIYPTTMASDKPTIINCPANFTLVLYTDKYPKETTWTLATESSGKLVAEGFGYKNSFEAHEETMCIKYDTCYMFEIKDKWDDGICCDNGPGSYAGFIEYSDSLVEPLPIPGLNGGAFETMQRHKFCLDGAGHLAKAEGLGGAIGVRFNGRHGQA